MLKEEKTLWQKLSTWFDKYFGDLFTNPQNRWRWEERWKNNN